MKRSRTPIGPFNSLRNPGHPSADAAVHNLSATYGRLSLLEDDFLVTNWAPSCHRYGFAAVADLARALGVEAMFNGYPHDKLKYSDRWDELAFMAYSVGFCGMTDLDGPIMKLGDSDEYGGINL